LFEFGTAQAILLLLLLLIIGGTTASTIESRFLTDHGRIELDSSTAFCIRNGRTSENLMEKEQQKAVEIELNSRSNEMEVADGDRAKQSAANWAHNLNRTVNILLATSTFELGFGGYKESRYVSKSLSFLGFPPFFAT
jgi:hypothetical protein